MKFATIKLKSVLICVLIFVIILSSVLISVTSLTTSSVSKTNITIVLDAGHGGTDGGSVGVNTKVKESDLNLIIAKKIEKLLKTFGFTVVQTRETEAGLYSKFGKKYKAEDMEVRKKIIQKSEADAVISIHLNSFSSSGVRGAQTYYAEGSEKGKELADIMQLQMQNQLEMAKDSSKFGDFYMVNCTTAPSVLIECGYLSSPEDEALLIQDEYQNKIAYCVFCGILKFFNVVYY